MKTTAYQDSPRAFLDALSPSPQDCMKAALRAFKDGDPERGLTYAAALGQVSRRVREAQRKAGT